ncbi:HyaD/HybD family hydrogenase maturation endopeptidase [Helicobacter suis]|uniref:HyaD/HybD family hydrogenase maturation endopeptidase n=1 Tax=Helicobacter suis TaxID=104628 RepID=UPI00196702F1|nr:HyaD/HybD family hydrogenase maturation endopeptidase [Helicobacter suis]
MDLKILVLGIGNILLGDEGVGVHLCHFLKHNYYFNPPIDCLDGGTLAQALIPFIVEYERVLLLDCVDVKDAQVGEVFCFDFNKLPENISWAGSAHEVEMLQTLKLTALVGDLPPTTIIGLIPSLALETTFELSNALLKGTQIALQKALEILKSWGIHAQLKPKPLDLQELAYLSYKL